VLAKALDGLPMDAEEAAIFAHHTGGRCPPTVPPAEAFVITGRRGGKTRLAGAVAARAAAFCEYPALAPGERPIIGLAAADRDQARTLLSYTLAPFEAPPLAALVKRRTQWELELTTGPRIEVRTSHYGRIRGRTFAGFIADEVAFWADDEGANPAEEVLTAVRPGLATIPGAQLIVISTPYARRGPLWTAYERCWGKDDPTTLVWRGTSLEMNPTLPESLVLDALERDEAAARAEWLAEFRRDVEGFVDREAVTACVVPDRRELAPLSGVSYVAFVDPSGGVADSMTLALAHPEERDGRRVAVLDVLRECKPPFSPEAVVADFAGLLAHYRVAAVTGDRYGGEWPREAFRRHGIAYDVADRPRSDLYRDLLPVLNSGSAELLDEPRLAAQLVGLERRTSRAGRESIDHGPHGHDDLANVAAGVLVLVAGTSPRPPLIFSGATGLHIVGPDGRDLPGSDDGTTASLPLASRLPERSRLRLQIRLPTTTMRAERADELHDAITETGAWFP
jgi:hypothetical protein